jgi:hypothetical protein
MDGQLPLISIGSTVTHRSRVTIASSLLTIADMAEVSDRVDHFVWLIALTMPLRSLIVWESRRSFRLDIRWVALSRS